MKIYMRKTFKFLKDRQVDFNKSRVLCSRIKRLNLMNISILHGLINQSILIPRKIQKAFEGFIFHSSYGKTNRQEYPGDLWQWIAMLWENQSYSPPVKTHSRTQSPTTALTTYKNLVYNVAASQISESKDGLGTEG